MFEQIKKGFGLTVGYILAVGLYNFVIDKVKKKEETTDEHAN